MTVYTVYTNLEWANKPQIPAVCSFDVVGLEAHIFV